MTSSQTDRRAFTIIDLLALCAVLSLCVLIVLPALGRTRNNNSLTQSMNNLRQLTSAWSMYPAQNNDRLVYSYPNFGANTNTWCRGNAANGGVAGSYAFGGADPAGIEQGDLWPYVHSLAPYQCPGDKRTAYEAPAPFKNLPILRSYSMNCYLAGTTFGNPGGDVSITNLATADLGTYRLFVKENQITKPSGIFVFIDEDSSTIASAMFIVDMGGTRGLVNQPSREHFNCYPISFADGHVETYRLQELASLTTVVTGGHGASGGITDWMALTNVATVLNH